MTEDFVVYTLLLSAVSFPAVACLRWYREPPRSTDSKWRKGALRSGIIAGLINALSICGYVWYIHHIRIRRLELTLGVAEICAGVGGCLCVVGLLRAILGKGRGRLTLAAGAASGALIWAYALISTAASLA